MSWGEVCLAAIVAGLLGLDAVSFPQGMVARPLVAASLGGLWAGDGGLGLWVGALLEILTLRQVPVGGARYHDTGPAAFAAGLAYADAGAGPFPLLLATAVGLGFGWIGGWTVQVQRQLNGRVVGLLAGAATPPARLVRRHLTAVGLDFARATALGALWIVAARALVLRSSGPAGLDPGAAALLLLAAAAGVGAALRTVARGGEVWRPFTAGVGVSIAGVLGVWLWA